MPQTVAITQARDRAQAAYAAAQDLMKANPQPTADQLKAIDGHLNDYDAAKRDMDTMLRLVEAEKAMGAPQYKTPRGTGSTDARALDTVADEAQIKTALHNRAFAKALRQVKEHRSALDADEQKSLSSLSPLDGGLATSEDFRSQLITRLRDRVMVRSRATIISTNAGAVGFPSFDYDGEAEITLEGEGYHELDITNILGKVQFTPFKRTAMFKVPEELVEDWDFDLVSLLTDRLAMRFGEIEENDYLNGDGQNKALGILKAPIPFVECTTSDVITAEDVMGLPYDVRAVYRGKGAYMTHRETLKKIRLLRDDSGATAGTGAFIWQPSFAAGQPSTVNGYPIDESEFFPSAFNATTGGDGKAALLFGDWSQYWIVDRKQFSVKVLDQLYAAEGKIGYQCVRRYDAAPVVLEAFKVLKRK